MGRRTLALLALATLAWAALGWQLYGLQVVRGPDLARQAVAQRTLALPVVQRGRILDQHGVPLHAPQPRTGVAIFPPLLTDPAAAAARLAPHLQRPAAQLLARLRAPGREPYWLAEDLPADAAAAIAGLELPGVAVAGRFDRYGPASLAHHLVGYVNVHGGQQGLERTLDTFLAGPAGPHLVAYVDGAGQALGGLGVRWTQLQAGKDPYDVHLTIDARVQAEVEGVLDAAGPQPDGLPLRAAVVVLDLRSGEVAAMASRPDFDPNQPALADPHSLAPLINRAVTPYPPGSVFKPLIAAYALDRGLARLDDTFYCSGHYQLADVTFKDSKRDGHGEISLGQAVALSCNVAFITLGYERMGKAQLLAAARVFGLHRPSGLPLDGEEVAPPPDPVLGGNVAQLAFGQDTLEVTPLQLARAYAALAGDGTLPGLRLVTKVTAPSGEVVFRHPTAAAERAISPEAARQVAGALAGVTDPEGEGTGRQAWVRGWGSVGKTGTAQAGPETTHAWFAGWVPLHRPRYVIVVLVENGSSGGGSAAPLFRAIAERVLAVGELP